MNAPGDDEYGVEAGESDENAVDGAPHLRSAEHDDGDEVAQKPEDPDAVEEDAGHHELEERVRGRGLVRGEHLRRERHVHLARGITAR